MMNARMGVSYQKLKFIHWIGLMYIAWMEFSICPILYKDILSKFDLKLRNGNLSEVYFLFWENVQLAPTKL